MEPKKTICFLIFAVGKANGGHYRSLRTIAETFMEEFNVFIINLGYTHSPIISESRVPSYFVFFNGLNILRPKREIGEIFDIKQVDLLHSFDFQSLLIGKLLSNKYSIPLIFTKCGGPNPKGYYPWNSIISLFSEENYAYFKNLPKYKYSVIKLISNRAEDFETDYEKIARLQEKFQIEKEIVILRICRISRFYLKSIMQSINLLNHLNEENNNVKLLIVGNIQDQNVYERIIELTKENNNIAVVTEDDFTLNAKEIIEIADLVIGTGRGFMEASSKSKVMLCPSSYGTFPVLVTENNFEKAFDKNFSERVEFTSMEEKESLQEIQSLLSNELALKKEKRESYNRYLENFSMIKGEIKYRELYSEAIFTPIKRKDILIHWSFVLKNNLGTWYRALKSSINE